MPRSFLLVRVLTHVQFQRIQYPDKSMGLYNAKKAVDISTRFGPNSFINYQTTKRVDSKVSRIGFTQYCSRCLGFAQFRSYVLLTFNPNFKNSTNLPLEISRSEHSSDFDNDDQTPVKVRTTPHHIRKPKVTPIKKHDFKSTVRRNLNLHLVDEELNAQLEDQPVTPIKRRGM